MAKKSGSDWNKITSGCAFFAVVIAGVIFLINALVQIFNGSFNGGILNTVATILLVIAVVIPGWRFTRGKKMWVKVLFWVCAIVLVVFGILSLN